MIRKSKVVFANEALEKTFESMTENDWLKRHIEGAIEDLKENVFSGIHVPKRLIPKEYFVKYNVRNLWKYDLPKGWRLLYTIVNENEVQLLSIILEWLDHKEYERRFGY